jgi:predicted dehydrogenase
MINIGIIGSSRMSESHLEVFSKLQNVKILAIASTKRGRVRRNKLSKRFNIKHSFDSYHEILACDYLDAICIATSIDHLFEISMETIKKGFNVLIEKPAGMNSKEVKELIKAKNKSNVQVSVGLQKKYSNVFTKAKEYINSNGGINSIVINAPERFEEIKSKKKYTKKVLSNWIISNGIHCIDLFNFFCGEHKKVFSISRKINGERIHENSIHSLIEFKNNSTGVYVSNWKSPAPNGYSIDLYGNNFRIIISPLEKGFIYEPNGRVKKIELSQRDKNLKPGLYKQNKEFIEALSKKSRKRVNTLEEYLVATDLAEKILNRNS